MFLSSPHRYPKVFGEGTPLVSDPRYDHIYLGLCVELTITIVVIVYRILFFTILIQLLFEVIIYKGE